MTNERIKKTNMPTYLNNLSAILDRKTNETDLFSVSKSDEIRGKIMHLGDLPTKTASYDMVKITPDDIRELILTDVGRDVDVCALWIDRSIICGAAIIYPKNDIINMQVMRKIGIDILSISDKEGRWRVVFDISDEEVIYEFYHSSLS